MAALPFRSFGSRVITKPDTVDQKGRNFLTNRLSFPLKAGIDGPLQVVRPRWDRIHLRGEHDSCSGFCTSGITPLFWAGCSCPHFVQPATST